MWRRARGRSRPRRSSTIRNIRSDTASTSGPPRTSRRSCAPRIERVAKRIYRTLELDGYARIDFRLSADGIPYFIEANPNPEIAQIEEFASAALHDGLAYPDLLRRILALGINRAGLAGIES